MGQPGTRHRVRVTHRRPPEPLDAVYQRPRSQVQSLRDRAIRPLSRDAEYLCGRGQPLGLQVLGVGRELAYQDTFGFGDERASALNALELAIQLQRRQRLPHCGPRGMEPLGQLALSRDRCAHR